MIEDDIAYFRRRCLEEREAANNADQAYVADIHNRMADRYEELLKSAEASRAEL